MTIEIQNDSWYVVHTQPRKELLVTSSLESRLGLEVFFPEVLQTYRGSIQPRPFFPRYLFVNADLTVTEASAINFSPGVIRLVSYGDTPQPIPATIIDDIRFRLDELNARGGITQHGFHPGDRVRVVSGPFQGLEAVFQGPLKPSERVRILLDFLGSLRETEIPVDLIERASTNFVRRRTTRGRGRRIRNQSQISQGSHL
ncbi:MAG: hypothetical protein J5I90_06150 [Caldilineales bacterium]|nr:hypothetical protein [Caldilineales bacterium]